MDSKNSWVNRGIGATAAVLLALLVPLYVAPLRSAEKIAEPFVPNLNITGQSRVCLQLAASLPDIVFSEQHESYKASQKGFWAQQACEDKPTCVVRPRDVNEVSRVVSILKAEDDAVKGTTSPLKFSVRSGGHFPAAGFASINTGVMVDNKLINDVTVSKDQTETRIGAGARWLDVYSRLDEMGLAVAGGRDSNVGVGGLVLGGGVSFYSPQVGMVCDNIISYEMVLANGTITTASKTQNPDLWRALKGGSGNFGIVTHVTAHTFPGSKIWGGHLYWTINQAPKVIRAFHDFAKAENFDKHAAGPILIFGYVQKLGLKLIASTVVSTKPEAWPSTWQGFKNIWRIWSTNKVRSLSDMTKELSDMSPYGKRQFQMTTTILNDHETLTQFVDEWKKSLKTLRKVKGLVTSLVFQPLSAAVTHKGTPNALGLGTQKADEPLIIVLLTAQWETTIYDDVVPASVRETVAALEAIAEKRGTANRYRYLNYAAPEQKVFDSYGEENKKFLQDTSRSFDPDGFWQRAKVGGYKLDMY